MTLSERNAGRINRPALLFTLYVILNGGQAAARDHTTAESFDVVDRNASAAWSIRDSRRLQPCFTRFVRSLGELPLSSG